MLSMSDHSYEDIEAEETAEESESEVEIEARSEADIFFSLFFFSYSQDFINSLTSPP
jgi:hypothetical protein